MSTSRDFLATVHPYDSLEPDELARVAGRFSERAMAKGEEIYAIGAPLDGLFLIAEGEVSITDTNGAEVSRLGIRNSFGERGLSRDGIAVTSARALTDGTLMVLPQSEFKRLIGAFPAFARFFDRTRPAETRENDLTTTQIADLMARNPVTCAPGDTIRDAARLMRDHHVSCLGVQADERLVGIITTRDLTGKALANGLPDTTPVAEIMTPDPETLPPSALGSDVLHAMLERGIGHVPVVKRGALVGMVTQTDLTRFQAVSSAQLVRDIAGADAVSDLTGVTERIPQLLAALVGAGNEHQIVTRLITDIADATTRRLLKMAEAKLGPPPVPYLWLACGSQGRQEQTGVSDQDNCLILDDAATPDDDVYFAALATFVTDGLDACGYVYCPGEMMATTPRWRQPKRVWREYFTGWIAKPDPMAQMLASVMFDLRPIGGTTALFRDLQAETLEKAAKNSIFVAHMVSNSLKHTPPLGLLRGLATIRSGEHKNRIDLKHNGVVPVVDLGRIYALQGRLEAVNTRARLAAAGEAGVLSPSGQRDLIDAYDHIADTRLRHQAAQIRNGIAPDNYMSPADLSDLERSYLRDAFVVVRTLQSSLGHGRGAIG